MELIELAKEKIKPSFSFRTARTPGRCVITAENLVIGYDSPLTKPLNFILERNQKVAVKGVNGLGKTTLLKTLLGIQPAISGKVELDQFVEVGYFEQEVPDSSKTALDTIWEEYPSKMCIRDRHLSYRRAACRKDESLCRIK